MDRRTFLQGSAGAILATMGTPSTTQAQATQERWPALNLPRDFTNPVIIKSIDIIRAKDKLWVRATAKDGAVGVVVDNGRLLDCRSLLERRVIPAFLDRDARDLPQLVEEAYTYRNNYKYSGMPFWVCVAFVELSVLDLLGRLARKPVGELFGEVIRPRIPVYLTRLSRETSPEEEVRILEKQLVQTGAKAVKIKIGGRLKNRPQDQRRTNALVPLARKELGEDIAINVDANGSYTVKEAIEVGRMLEEHHVGFFEEPLLWEEHAGTKEVADALKVTVAGGEQDTSPATFRWMIDNGGFDLVQPDLYYNGGIIRALNIAQMAAEKNIPITPHSPKTGAPAAPMLHFASITPNLGPYQEYVASPEIKNGHVEVPREPGLGRSLTDRECREAKAI